MKENLTTKEIEVLKYINEVHNTKLRFKINTVVIAEEFQLNELQLREMLQRFKEKGLVKKNRKGLYLVGEIMLEVIGEVISGF